MTLGNTLVEEALCESGPYRGQDKSEHGPHLALESVTRGTDSNSSWVHFMQYLGLGVYGHDVRVCTLFTTTLMIGSTMR